jgi:hypothetical protein
MSAETQGHIIWTLSMVLGVITFVLIAGSLLSANWPT